MLNVDLGPELERFVSKLAESGRYGSVSEVLREGVRLVQERETRFAADDATANSPDGKPESYDEMSSGAEPEASTRRQYIHLVRAMQPGDALYLPDRNGDLNRQIVSAVGRSGGRVSTAKYVAIGTGPQSAHWVLKITMLEPLRHGIRVHHAAGDVPRPRGRPSSS